MRHELDGKCLRSKYRGLNHGEYEDAPWQDQSGTQCHCSHCVKALKERGHNVIDVDRKYRTLNFGSDPEFLLIDKSTEEYIPAGEVLPDPITTSPRYGTRENVLTHDNAAVEIQTGAAYCIDHDMRNIQKSMRELAPVLHEHDLAIVPEQAAEFDMERLSMAPGGMEFGCDPSGVLKDDLTVEKSVPADCAPETAIRSAGFHLHFGTDLGQGGGMMGEAVNSVARRRSKLLNEADFQKRLIQMCDILIGLPGTMLEKPWSEAARLRRMELGYGVAGEFRPQPHGIEYRTLGSWPIISPEWSWWAYSMARGTFLLTEAGADEYLLDVVERDAVMDAINRSDFDLARSLWIEVRSQLMNMTIVGIRGSSDGVGKTAIKKLENAIANRGVFTEGYMPPGSIVDRWDNFKDHGDTSWTNISPDFYRDFSFRPTGTNI